MDLLRSPQVRRNIIFLLGLLLFLVSAGSAYAGEIYIPLITGGDGQVNSAVEYHQSTTCPTVGHTVCLPPVFPVTTIALPLCSDHNPIKWHALIDYVRHCHYDHEHGDNPHDGDSMFGPWAAAWGGQEISYPWQTFSAAGVLENDAKHGGYKVYVNTALANTGSHNLNWSVDRGAPGQNNWITAVRTKYHFHGLHDAAVRLHSFYVQYRVCLPGGVAPCGTISGGGWMDTGFLEAPYKGNNQVVIPGQDPSVSKPIGLDPYRGHEACPSVGPHDPALWTTVHNWGRPTTPYGYPIEYNNHLGMFVVNHDSTSCTVLDSEGEQQMRCSNGQCWYNNTLRAPFTLWAWVNPVRDGQAGFDEDGQVNGRVTYHGYTNRRGAIATGCAQAGPNCIPYALDNAPVGYAAWDSLGHGWMPQFPGVNREYDTSPKNVFWVDVHKN